MSSRQPQNDVFAFLDEVEKRPSLYIGDGGLSELELILHGYDAALSLHGIVENAPSMHAHFSSWLALRTGWSMSCGWAHAICDSVSGRDRQMRYFFDSVRSYRKLRPRVIATVELSEHHEPVGRHLVVGNEGQLQRPTRIDIVRYADTPLHFLRFHHAAGIETHGLLRNPRSDWPHDVECTADDATKWVAEEFQVTATEWEWYGPDGNGAT